MKRQPEKNYKKPNYALGMAALLAMGAMTGCTEPPTDVQIDGGMDVPEDTRYVELSGDAAIETEEVMLDGDVAIEPEETCIVTQSPESETEEFMLAGDVVME